MTSRKLPEQHARPYDALLDAYRLPDAVVLPRLSTQRAALLAQLRQRYADAHGDAVLQRTHADMFAAELLQWDRDPIALLKGLKFALDDSVPVPKHIADVLSSAISRYLAEKPGAETLDKALGLVRRGPLTRRAGDKQAHALRGALGRMFSLQLVGATVPQAALLVSRLSPDFKPSTLEDRYRRGGYSDRLKDTKALVGPVALDPAAILAEYPNAPRDAAKAKASILAMYAKRRITRT